MNRTTLHILAGCLLSLTLGVAAGSFRGALTAKSPARLSLQAPVQPNSPSTPPPNIAPSTYRDSFIQAVRTEKGAKRWLLLLSATEKATPEELSALIRDVGEDSAAMRIIAARWAELDPRHMFSWLHAHYLENAPGTQSLRHVMGDVLFEYWTKSDTAGAIKALTDLHEFSGRESLRTKVINEVMKLDAEQGL
nr:hypothetical protein [Verrucomicrobiota bacterium]